PEIQQVPGTFGDPFRVVQTLPGVASVVSLLPFPIVRGATPSSTGFLLDGTRVPLLYHLLSGPSVIHPEFIDEIQFYPGGAPAPYADPNAAKPPLAPSLILGFHRVDLRLHHTFARLEATSRVVLGYDRTFSMGTDFSVWNAEARQEARWVQGDRLTLSAGLTG